ncbi:hypothetical protein ACWD6R_05025 [Streptomyces sp. NPDC005151]
MRRSRGEPSLTVFLAGADNWEYPDSGDGIGCPTLALTEGGRRIPW